MSRGLGSLIGLPICAPCAAFRPRVCIILSCDVEEFSINVSSCHWYRVHRMFAQVQGPM